MVNTFKKKFGSNIINTVLVVLIVLILAFISTRRFIRLDLTEDARFSISSATKDMLHELDDVVTIKLFFSKRLPPDLLLFSQHVQDVLDEYKSYARPGMLEIMFLDPVNDPKALEEVRGLGIPELQMTFYEKDRTETQAGYLGMGVFFEERAEGIPVITSTNNFEYEVTAAIKKVTTTEVKTVGFLTGHGEHSVEDFKEGSDERGDLLVLSDLLEKSYKVITVDVSSGDPISGVDTLVVAGPKEPLLERELYEIDQFVMNGGNVVWLVDGVEVNPQLGSKPSDNNLDGLFKQYGFEIEKKLVRDASSHESASFSQGFLTFVQPYQLWPKLIKQNFSAQNPISASLDSIVLPWSSPIKALSEDVISIASTTEDAYAEGEPYNIDPTIRFGKGNGGDQFTMAAFKSGKVESFFTGKPKPPVPSKESGENVKEPEYISMSEENSTKLSTDGETKMVIVGNSLFITDSMIRQFPSNLGFVQNAIDYITLDDSLIEIRAKNFSEKPLKDIGEPAKNTIKFLVTFGVALIVAVLGFVKSWIRKKAKNKLLAL